MARVHLRPLSRANSSACTDAVGEVFAGHVRNSIPLLRQRVLKTTLKLVLSLLACTRFAVCQNAQLSGLVSDPSAAAIAAAEISLRNELTGGRRTSQSNESGLYSLPSLSPGLYRITIRATGFETVIREGVKLEVGDNIRLDFALRIGDARTTVTVSSELPLMNTEDASVGTV